MSEDLLDILHDLMALPTETEWVEFKEAKVTYDLDDIGRYVSALSNEANLNGKPEGWLVFGVTNKPPRRIVGSHYRENAPGLDRLKREISKETNHGFTFSATHEVETPNGRVVMFRVPPAPRGIPTEWRSVVYGRVHESLCTLSFEKSQRIRDQSATTDWSARVCEEATIDDLDPTAIAFALEQYKTKFPNLAHEVDSWDTVEFLNRGKLCIKGKITNAALLLLGKSESEHYLSPASPQVTWVLKDEAGVDKDYAHFGSPLILAVDAVFGKIRNLTYRHISDETLFPLEISQYDPWVIREVLHNCIAHSDYSKGAKITVIEHPDFLRFTNRGDFIPGSVEYLLSHDAPPDVYRNPFLARAMVSLNMIDTIGSGIRRMFRLQRERSFPLPDYDLSEPGRVSVIITGKVIDPKYTRMLIRRKDLDLLDVLALDKVQKGRAISESEFRSLKSKKLIEGRRPHLFVSAQVAAETDTRAEYIRKRSFDKQHFKDMVISYLNEYQTANRQELDKLLMNKVSDALDDKQKRSFIRNLLQEMRREGMIIVKEGRTTDAKWALVRPIKEEC
ncbi:MAG: RNA-binding domain-containing protein [Methanospirillum sp.]